jgi:hypothetical protein
VAQQRIQDGRITNLELPQFRRNEAGLPVGLGVVREREFIQARLLC